MKVHCPFDAVSIDQQSSPHIIVGYYLKDCGLEAPEYIRYFLQKSRYAKEMPFRRLYYPKTGVCAC